MGSHESVTVFFSLCVLGADFMIYFFLKLVLSERYRTHARRLPRHYYNTKDQTSALHQSPIRKSRLPSQGRIVPLPLPSPKCDPRARTPRTSFAEPIPFRRVS